MDRPGVERHFVLNLDNGEGGLSAEIFGPAGSSHRMLMEDNNDRHREGGGEVGQNGGEGCNSAGGSTDHHCAERPVQSSLR